MQKIVISGASSGLGLELAKRLSKKYYIICFARNLDKLKKKFSSNKNVEIYKVDLNNFKNLEKFLNKIILKHKNISAIINNAGQMYINDVSKIEIKKMIKVYNVNVFSPIIIMKYMINHMIKNNYGRIVNITSGAPLNCFKEYSIYSSTKASLNSATITASKEINDKNITINLVSPGPIKDITKLVSKENKINGKFIWRGKIIPIFPNLKGINWLKGKATKNYKKI
jgi:3-oxoacyl-[acyl-carrier protein] reductase